MLICQVPEEVHFSVVQPPVCPIHIFRTHTLIFVNTHTLTPMPRQDVCHASNYHSRAHNYPIVQKVDG